MSAQNRGREPSFVARHRLLLLAVYVGVYGWLRADGDITHQQVPVAGAVAEEVREMVSPAWSLPRWRMQSYRVVFSPLMVVEEEARSLVAGVRERGPGMIADITGKNAQQQGYPNAAADPGYGQPTYVSAGADGVPIAQTPPPNNPEQYYSFDRMSAVVPAGGAAPAAAPAPTHRPLSAKGIAVEAENPPSEPAESLTLK